MTRQGAPHRGYLNEDFRLFRLTDGAMAQVDWHYHDFHKILFFLAGHAAYAIEGQSYALEPGDMVLVPRGSIHRPEVQPGLAYERYVLYLSPEYLRGISDQDADLAACFKLVADGYRFALRPQEQELPVRLLRTLYQTQSQDGFGQRLLCQALITQLLVSVTRNLEAHQLRYITSKACDEKIVGILKYLNLHLNQNLSIDDLAKQFFISKYYMMRRFKAETGYTIHNYLTEKRLFLARERITAGVPLSQVSMECGFGDYSTFSRAYKRRFGVSPNTPIPRVVDSTSSEPMD